MKKIPGILLFLILFTNTIWSQDTVSFLQRAGFRVSVSSNPFLTGIPYGGEASASYIFNDHFSAGAGAGFLRMPEMNTYDTIIANLNMMPIFLQATYTPLKSVLTPFVTLQGGYSFLINQPSSDETFRYVPVFLPYAWNEYYDYDAYKTGGYYFNIEAGLQVKLKKKLSAFLSANYSFFQVHGTHYSGVYQYLPGQENNTTVITTYDSWDVMARMEVFLLKAGITF